VKPGGIQLASSRGIPLGARLDPRCEYDAHTLKHVLSQAAAPRDTHSCFNLERRAGR